MAHEFDGKKYEKTSTHQKEWGNRLISELEIKGSENILDLGCGDGGLTEVLAELVPGGSVLGVDASRGMIEVAKKKENKNLKFLLMDINNIELGEKFDLVFSNATLHWVKDHKSLWSTIERLLNPGGVVRFNFAAAGNCSHFFKVIRAVMMLEEYEKLFSGFNWPWYMPEPEEYKSLIKDNSFSEKKVWGENADRFFPDKEAMIGWVDQPSIVPFLKLLPEEKKRVFRDLVIEQMLEATLQEDGRCFETFRRINVLAEK